MYGLKARTLSPTLAFSATCNSRTSHQYCQLTFTDPVPLVGTVYW